MSAVLTVFSARPEAEDGDLLALFVRRTPDGPLVEGRDVPKSLLADLNVSGAADQVVRIPAGVLGDSVAVLSGLGSEATESAWRAAAGAAARHAAGSRRLILDAGAVERGVARALLEGAGIGAYAYEGRPRSSEDREPLRVIALVTDGALTDVVDRASIVVAAVALSRDLANTPPSQQPPAALAQSAREAVAGLPVDVTEWDEEGLARDGFGGILGVGSGSTRPPRLVRLDYSPAGSGAHLALVGKGITFDSGGLSLKPPVSMVGMKYDMAGAASVLAVVMAAARLELPVRVTGWLCLAENMPSGSAIRPNDVLTMRGGTTVEVLNTDAEGRLVMADGLRVAIEEEPDAVIDIATLTGAQMVALGTRYSAVMGDDDLVKSVIDAAEKAGELVWPMPLPDELRATIASDVADIANAAPGKTAGGMLLAGVFLREFARAPHAAPDAPHVPWAHLDIAGPAQNNGSPYGYAGKGATGVLVRTLVDFVAALGEHS